MLLPVFAGNVVIGPLLLSHGAKFVVVLWTTTQHAEFYGTSYMLQYIQNSSSNNNNNDDGHSPGPFMGSLVSLNYYYTEVLLRNTT